MRYDGGTACCCAMSIAESREEGPDVAAPIVRIVHSRGNRPCRPRRFPQRPPLPAHARRPRPHLQRSGVRSALPEGWSTGRSARPPRPGDHHAVCRRPLRPAGRRRGTRPPELEISPRPGADRPRLRRLRPLGVPGPPDRRWGGSVVVRDAADAPACPGPGQAARATAHRLDACARRDPRPQSP